MSKKKPKVTIFHFAFIYTGGGERIVFEEVLGLRKKGYPVECFTPILDKKKCFPDLIEEVKIRTFLPQLPSWFPLRHAIVMSLSILLAPILVLRFSGSGIFVGANYPGALFAYLAAKIWQKPNICYLNHPNRMLYPRSKNRRKVWQAVPDFYFLSYLIDFVKPLAKFIDRLAIVNSKAVLSNGSFVQKEIEKVYGVKCVDCPAGCNPVSKRELEENIKKAFEGEFKINNFLIKKPYVFLASRHEEWKRFDLAIRAMALVLKEVETTLVLPGPFTPYTFELRELVKKLGIEKKVLFLGKVSEKELMRLYQEAAVYAYPSTKEDFGMVVIESMAHGVPVVCWNRGGPVVTVVDGVSGLLAKPYEVSDFAQKLIFLLKNPQRREEMGRRAYEHVVKNFTWKHHVDILEKEIEKALV